MLLKLEEGVLPSMPFIIVGANTARFWSSMGAENLRLVRCVELVQRHNLTLPRESHGPVCRRSFRARHSCPVLGGAV